MGSGKPRGERAARKLRAIRIKNKYLLHKITHNFSQMGFTKIEKETFKKTMVKSICRFIIS